MGIRNFILAEGPQPLRARHVLDLQGQKVSSLSNCTMIPYFVQRMILRPIFVSFVPDFVKKSGIMERLSAFPGTAAGQRPTYNYVGKKVEMVLRKVKMVVEN